MASYSEIDADEFFPSNDSMAIVVAQPKPLAIVPSKELAIMPPKEVGPVPHHQSYYTQAMSMLRLSSPPSHLSIEGPRHQQEMPKFCVSKEFDILPPKPNEVLIGLKMNKFGDVTCMKYRSTTPSMYFEVVRAMLE
jgi:hypothetical protein